MSGKKIVVPEGMLEAATPVYINDIALVGSILEAALRWLSENPLRPNDKQLEDLYSQVWVGEVAVRPSISNLVVEWQRRMFLQGEPEVPEEIADLIFSSGGESIPNKHILEAYRRGRESR